MTRDEFVRKWQHEITGLVTDAALVCRSGALQAQWLREAIKRIDLYLVQMHHDLTKEANNGRAGVPGQVPPQKSGAS